ncbi:phosphoenolpyruvate carboxykinase (ATP) [candidate division WOR-3 bacterium]|nr:phosphoenolpyruvate carboxykinase (ATP) [candidate division WOR-3 bacterium]
MHIPIEELFPQVKVLVDSTQEHLREISKRDVPGIFETTYGSLLRVTKRKARKAARTYIISEESESGDYSHKIIDKDKAGKLIENQAEYIRDRGELIVINRYIGLNPRYAVAMQWVYTTEGANLAAMQQVMSFPRELVETKEQLAKPFQSQFRLIMTPDCPAEDMPEEIAIIVDLDNWSTYVLNSDYFGESKKGALRMLNEYIHQKGGLVLHAGAKEVVITGKRTAMGVMGLSGTGKTTTTFSKQGELTRPIQDDMISLWPSGKIGITENGCFAKTFGLKEESEPTIYKGTVSPTTWLENVYLNEDGTLDFSKQLLAPEEVMRWKDTFIVLGEKEENINAYINGTVRAEDRIDEDGVPEDGWDFLVWTKNGRSIIPLKEIKDAADLYDIPDVESIGMLNRDEGHDAATPGIIHFQTPEQAAAYFMLGETSKTSAAGKERGKTRSPFTQPFFPRKFGLQAKRFSELLKTMPDLDTWLMNTGYVGGSAKDKEDGKALKVKIHHSSAMLEAMLSGKIIWRKDPDFGYEIVDVDHPSNQGLLDKVPAEILNPVLFYEKNGRMDEYRDWVRRMKEERREFLLSYDVDKDIVNQV